ncbi:MAG: Acyl-CoA dehydrogenase [uncultured Solirubrobacteraceae bacterium]|uniref:Acyl-CoA dehydrogenase n=1 Tax=uncultured Solirubrobacteraceae bacterium TaxID=1162706 RepID=A0A6J4U4B5_9ACTN|nr:MAG: Acyl-CoA dehydrogenase [uncultured Solirubrobacteraceae bacterium]
MSVLDLTDERRAFVEAIRDFCARETATREQRGDESHNAAIYAKLAELGWIGVSIPEQYGGSGGGLVDMCLLLEETMYGLAPVGAVGTTMIVAGAYERFGNEEQKEEILGGIARGAIEAIAMSEPEAGSDVGALQCRAERRNGSFVINGQKTWISNAHNSDHILLIARSDRSGSKHEGLTMLNVPAGIEGMEVRSIDTMGGRETNDVFFTDCEVPAEAVVGQEGAAWMQLMAGLNVERLIIAAQHLGQARRALDDTLAYVKERKQFGRPVGSFQTLKHRLADLATEVECCRLLVYDVAARVDANPGAMFPREASMAKLKVTETAKAVALEGMQMMGGYGYATEYDMERHVRGALVGTIYGGTSEIQRDIIGKTYGL